MMHAAYWVSTWPPITGVLTGFAKPKNSTKPLPPQRVISRRGIRGAKTPRAFVIRQTCRRPGQFGALGFYHLRVFLPVLTRAFADFSLLSLLSPKMRSQSLLEIPLNPTRKRSWCSSVFGFCVDVDVGV